MTMKHLKKIIMKSLMEKSLRVLTKNFLKVLTKNFLHIVTRSLLIRFSIALSKREVQVIREVKRINSCPKDLLIAILIVWWMKKTVLTVS